MAAALLGGHSGDAGPDATAGTTDCNPACGSGSVCVGTGVQGGAVFFADGGVCPAGRHAQQHLHPEPDLRLHADPERVQWHRHLCLRVQPVQRARGLWRAEPGELTCILAVP